jgi:hypothetical protein
VNRPDDLDRAHEESGGNTCPVCQTPLNVSSGFLTASEVQAEGRHMVVAIPNIRLARCRQCSLLFGIPEEE